VPNFIERKHPRKGEKRETKGKDQSSGKQKAQQREAIRRKGNN
jgi:hypothetical protein